MHEIRVSIVSPEAADHGVAELWAADELIGYTILHDTDLMLRIEPRRDQTAVLVGAHGLAQAINRAEQLLERYCPPQPSCQLVPLGAREEVRASCFA